MQNEETMMEKTSQPMDIEEEGGMVQMVTLGKTILTYQFVEKQQQRQTKEETESQRDKCERR
jgi:hypothetical protein